jgi:hypothetical protein
MQLNGELTRYLLLAVTAPLWWPFLRELYREMNAALREEGGLLGRGQPSKGLEHYSSPLVSTPFRDAQGPRQPEPRQQPPAARPEAPAQAAPTAGFERRRGFRER